MATLLKNLYSQEFIEKLSISLQDKYKNFKKDEFKKAIFTNAWEDFELKQRMRHISKTLKVFLPFSYKEQIEILIEVKKDFKAASYTCEFIAFETSFTYFKSFLQLSPHSIASITLKAFFLVLLLSFSICLSTSSIEIPALYG
ncbi:hypothetical protein AS859_10165, partial [Aliarcobacter cryaerophilus]